MCVHACRITHVISILSASQLHFLANKNPELADRTTIGEHVALLSGPTHSRPQTVTVKNNEAWAWGRGWALLFIRYTVPQVTRCSDGSKLAQTTALQTFRVFLYLMKIRDEPITKNGRLADSINRQPITMYNRPINRH